MIVDGVLPGGYVLFPTSPADDGEGEVVDRSWFQTIARLPLLDDRVWDARLISCGEDPNAVAEGDGGDGGCVEESEGLEGESRLMAVALAHNSVEVHAARDRRQGRET